MPLSRGECEALVSAGVLMGARVDTSAGWMIDRPHHLWHFSCAVLAGTFKLTTAAGENVVRAGDPAWIAPTAVGFKLEATGQGPQVLLWWSINPSFWTGPKQATQWPQESTWLIRTFTRLADERDDTGELAERTRRALSLLAAVEVERGFMRLGGGKRSGLDAATRRVLAAISNDPLRPWTLGELANLGECSIGHLTRRFRASGLPPPLQALRRRRLAMAASLLVETDQTLERIAEKTGYESPFSLSRAFTRMFGSSPARYRRLHAAG